MNSWLHSWPRQRQNRCTGTLSVCMVVGIILKYQLFTRFHEFCTDWAPRFSGIPTPPPLQYGLVPCRDFKYSHQSGIHLVDFFGILNAHRIRPWLQRALRNHDSSRNSAQKLFYATITCCKGACYSVRTLTTDFMFICCTFRRRPSFSLLFSNEDCRDSRRRHPARGWRALPALVFFA